METFWHDSFSLNFEINKVGRVYELYGLTDVSKESLAVIRRETGHGFMDSRKLLELYLERIGMKVDENKQIIKI